MLVGRAAWFVHCKSSGKSRNSKRVARRSFGETGLKSGTPRLAVDSPLSFPLCIPPPARTRLLSCGQCSQPPSLLTCGDRPSSPTTANRTF